METEVIMDVCGTEVGGHEITQCSPIAHPMAPHKLIKKICKLIKASK